MSLEVACGIRFVVGTRKQTPPTDGKADKRTREKRKSAEAIKRAGDPNRESGRASIRLGRPVVHTANGTLPIEKNFRKLPLVIRTIFVQRMSGNGEEIAASLRSKRSLVYSTVARASVVQPRTPWLVIE